MKLLVVFALGALIAWLVLRAPSRVDALEPAPTAPPPDNFGLNVNARAPTRDSLLVNRGRLAPPRVGNLGLLL